MKSHFSPNRLATYVFAKSSVRLRIPKYASRPLDSGLHWLYVSYRSSRSRYSLSYSWYSTLAFYGVIFQSNILPYSTLVHKVNSESQICGREDKEEKKHNIPFERRSTIVKITWRKLRWNECNLCWKVEIGIIVLWWILVHFKRRSLPISSFKNIFYKFLLLLLTFFKNRNHRNVSHFHLFHLKLNFVLGIFKYLFHLYYLLSKYHK